MKIKFKIELTPSQKEAYALAHKKELKFLSLAWSRQSGKSTLMEVLCIEWLLQRNNSIGYVCRNYILAKKIYKELVKLIPSSLVKSANGSDLEINSTFGSSIKFYSAESGASLRGQTFDYLILDEFAFHSFIQTDGTNLWNDILSPTVKVKGKKCIFVSTPLGKNNLFYDMFLRGLDSDFPQYSSLKKTIYDDGLIDEQGIEDIKKSIPDISFRQEYLCEFLDSSITYFKDFDKQFTEYKFDDNAKISIGIDFSASKNGDETVLTKITSKGYTKQYTVTGTLDERYKQIADIINSTPNMVNCQMESNSIGTPMYNSIIKLLDIKHRDKCELFTTTNSTKDEIISDLQMSIANKEIYFDSNDMKLFKQFANFICHWSKTGKPQYEGANGVHDDCIMSMAIAWNAKLKYQKNGNRTFATVFNF